MNAGGPAIRRWTRSLPEHDRRYDRVLGAGRGEHALLQVDAIDPVVPEDVVAVGLYDTPHAVEIPVTLHPSQGHIGLPRASLRGESDRLDRGVQGRAGPPDTFRSLAAAPDEVHLREIRRHSGPSDSCLVRTNV